jgi:hypothetical protein
VERQLCRGRALPRLSAVHAARVWWRAVVQGTERRGAGNGRKLGLEDDSRGLATRSVDSSLVETYHGVLILYLVFLDPAPTFDPQSVLPSLLRPIKAFLSTPSRGRIPSSDLLSQDLQILSTATSTLASQTIASEPFQLALFNTPFFLSSLLRFIELVDLPPSPTVAPPKRDEGMLSSDDETDDEDEDHEKTLSLVKGTLVSVVVAVFGEDEVGELVLGSGAGEGKELRDVLERWVGLAVTETGAEGREDLGICAVLSLGNLARNGQSQALSPPHASCDSDSSPDVIPLQSRIASLSWRPLPR